MCTEQTARARGRPVRTTHTTTRRRHADPSKNTIIREAVSSTLILPSLPRILLKKRLYTISRRLRARLFKLTHFYTLRVFPTSK